MNLKSMKLSDAQDAKEDIAEGEDPNEKDGPEYPYGLKLYLNEDSISNLELSSMPALGDTMMIMAKVEITEVSQSKGEDREVYRQLAMQITDMGIASKAEDKSAALYGPKGK